MFHYYNTKCFTVVDSNTENLKKKSVKVCINAIDMRHLFSSVVPIRHSNMPLGTQTLLWGEGGGFSQKVIHFISVFSKMEHKGEGEGS